MSTTIYLFFFFFERYNISLNGRGWRGKYNNTTTIYLYHEILISVEFYLMKLTKAT